MNRMNVFSLLMLFGLSVWGADKVEVTSQNLRGLLESKNAKVQIAKFEQEAALERTGFWGRSFFPSLELYGAQEVFKVGAQAERNQPSYGVEARFNVFHGGRDYLENQIRSLEAGKKGFQAKRVLSEELEKARSAYWQLLYLKETEALTRAALEVNKQNLSSAIRRIQSGVATQTDRFEFEMKEIELRSILQKNAVEMMTQSRVLALMLGLHESSSLTTSENLVHDHDFEKALEHGLKDHEYLVKEAKIEAEQRVLKAHQQTRVWWPRVDLYTAFNQYNQRDKDPAAASDRTDSVIGIKATMSLPSGLESQREAAALTRESLAAEALSRYQERELEIHLQGETAELKLLHDQVHDVEENIQRAERYYKLTLAEYARGVKNSPDVLGASEKLFAIKHRKLEIVRDFQLAKTHVLSKIGR